MGSCGVEQRPEAVEECSEGKGFAVWCEQSEGGMEVGCEEEGERDRGDGDGRCVGRWRGEYASEGL